MALNKDQKLAISSALNKLLREEGVNISEDVDLFSELLTDETSGPITLYVESTGSDSNSGTIGAPLATIQEALNRIPKNIKHPVNIYIAAGTYKGFVVSEFNIPYINNTLGAYLNIKGALIDATVTTGSVSGTVSSGTAGSGATHGTLVKSGEVWTANDLRGKFVEITGGTGSGQIFPIASNTNDTITICGSWTAPNGTSSFTIKDCGTVCTGLTAIPTEIDTSTSASLMCVGFSNNRAWSRTSATANIGLQNIKITRYRLGSVSF